MAKKNTDSQALRKFLANIEPDRSIPEDVLEQRTHDILALIRQRQIQSQIRQFFQDLGID